MKRSRHRWLRIALFCVALAILSADVPTTSAARATSLFKTTTSTAAPEEEPTGTDEDAQVESSAEEESSNSTKKLTGIPQIDYIHDPNLPRELNGYNLSEYPFYETVPPPETMDFKCDGLHDGFYASIPHKCQVYHHCLFGTRYDFLCANYTAFDQKTFICQFVSEVDCKNSANWFSRNEALYKAASTEPPSTTTTSTTTTTTTTTRPPRPGRRRPRPRYDYYDDDYYYPRDDYDYEERGGRRNRPRSRPGKRRPADDYDDRYETRPRPRDEAEEDYEDRRSYDRPRPGKRPYSDNRRPYDDEERRPYKGGRRPGRRDEEEDRYVPDDVAEERPKGGKFRPRDQARPRDDDRVRDEIRPRDEVRTRDEISPRDEVKSRDEIKPRDEIRSRDEIKPRDEIRSREEFKSRDEIRPRDEVRSRDEIKPRDEVRSRDEIRPKDGIKPRDERRTFRDDTTAPDNTRPRDRFQSSEGRRLYDRPARGRDERPYLKPERNYESEDRTEEKRQVPTASEGQPMVKPNGRGIFSKPRPPPKIKRPVPLNEKDKYDYVPLATTKPPPKADDEYYDDYEEDDTRKPLPSTKASTVQQKPKLEPIEKEKFKPSRPHFTSPAEKLKNPKKTIDYDEEEYYYEPPAKSQKYTQGKEERPTRSKDDDYYYDDREKIVDSPRKNLDEDVTAKVKELRPGVKVIRRPFLPSRGGSPYLPRGLQPVAGKNLRLPPNTTPKPTTTSTTTTTTTSTTTTTTPKPTTTSKPTTTTTERKTTTTTTTTEKPTTTERLTTTERVTTTIATEKPSTTTVPEEEYEYYDEEDIEYEGKDKKEPIESTPAEIKEPSTTTVLTTTNSRETTTYDREQFLEAIKDKPRQPVTTDEAPKISTTNERLSPITTEKPKTNLDNERPRNPARNEEKPRYSEIDDRPRKPLTSDDRAKNLATKVLRNFNDNYDAIKEQLESTLTPGDYLKPYLSQLPSYREVKRPEIKPEISKGYTATGKPLKLPDIKQNLADSIENEYDVRLNEALAPNLPVRIPSGFVIPSERDYSFSRFRNNFHAEPQFAASELSHYQVRKRPQISGVSIRTPTSYYLQPQRVVYEESLARPARQLYRQLGNIF